MLRSRQASHSIVSAAALNQRKDGAQRCAMFARHYFFSLTIPCVVLCFKHLFVPRIDSILFHVCGSHEKYSQEKTQ